MVDIKKGDVFVTNQGGSVEVIEYRNFKNVVIRHLDKYGYTETVQKGNLERGRVKNPYYPSVHGIGYMGVGKYGASSDKQAYRVWKNLLLRVHYEKIREKVPTYHEVTIVEEWYNFQNFAEWYYKQPNHDTKGFALDKDLLVLGNKVYGPDFCSFVPQSINNLLTDAGKSRGELPIGVTRNGNGYQAHISVQGKKKMLGTYDTIDTAYAVRNDAKKRYIEQCALEYKEYLHPKVYENLMNWEQG